MKPHVLDRKNRRKDRMVRKWADVRRIVKPKSKRTK